MPGDGTVYRFGPFELDATRRRLFRSGVPVALPDSHIAILLRLIVANGDVVSKETLADAAWGGAAIGGTSLKKAISRMRKPLGDEDDGAPRIETVPNRGYRFAAAVERTVRHDLDGSIDALLAPYRVFVDGQHDLDTLDCDAVVRARRAFEEVLRKTPDSAGAHVGLANACAYIHESTRADVEPDVAALHVALEHALKGCDLDPASADAWSTLAFVLCLKGDSHDAEAAAGKAVALEPDNWRHAMRLAYVSWGETRLHGARRVLDLLPGAALAYYLIATVFVARQAFEAALEILEEGCAAQDAQSAGTANYRGVGLHLHRGRVLAAMGHVEAAVAELTRELDATPHGHIYARECVANTWYSLGALRQRQGRRDDAAAAFKEAVRAVPDHIGATAALGGDPPSARRCHGPHTIDLAVGRSIGLTREGRHREAARLCADALTQAPPGWAGWLLPVEPTLNPTARPDIWEPALAILRDRAR